MTEETLGELPFFRLFRIYLEHLDKEGELKLTARGNLLTAFGTAWSPPDVQFQRCYRVRTHERCLAYYGFVEVHGERFSDDFQLRATALFWKVFKLKTTG